MQEKNVFTIPPYQNFLSSLLKGIHKKFGNDIEYLKNMTILLPNNRSCQNFKEAFLKYNNNHVILPKIKTIDSIEICNSFSEKNSIISPIKQQMILTRLIYQWYKLQNKNTNLSQSAFLAIELNKLLNELETEQISLKKLENINQCENAFHWEEILKFLSIIIKELPRILNLQKELTVAMYRNINLKKYGLSLEKNPPKYPIIVAGSTGSIMATSDLIKTISSLDNGYIILPYIDKCLDNKSWEVITEIHPQYNIKKLLEKLEVKRENISNWDDDFSEDHNKEKLRFISEVMRPSETIESWNSIKGFSNNILNGIERIEMNDSYSEAYAVAMKIRLNLGKKKIAVITKDEVLSHYISTILKKWNININSLKATNLLSSNEARLFIYIMNAFTSRFAPIELLKCLKHPLINMGINKETFSKQVQKLEIKIFRGIRPKQDLSTMLRQIKELEDPELLECCESIFSYFKRVESLMKRPYVSFKTVIEEHIRILENLVKGPAISINFWETESAIELENFLNEIILNSSSLDTIRPFEYSGIIEALFKNQKYYPKNNTNFGVSILTPIEARMHDCDLVIAAGLNEKMWPSSISNDPWMNSEMRRKLGLISSEKIIGREAYDFSQILCAKEIVITRCNKIGSVITTKSRWLLRIETLCSILKIKEFEASNFIWQTWINELEKPKDIRPIEMPLPKPAVNFRPKTLSASSIELLIRDPYSIYANKILNLKALEDIDSDPGSAEFGNFIHKSIDIFTKNYKDIEEDKWYDFLLECGNKILKEETYYYPSLEVLWYPKFEKIAKWLISEERNNSNKDKKISSEIKGSITMRDKNIAFTITATADRIEYVTNSDQITSNIIDYKTGSIPTKADVHSGFSPQLLIEALIMEEGGFEKPYRVKDLEYWKLSGSNKTNIKHKIADEKNIEQLLGNTKQGIKSLLEFFNNPENPYIPCPFFKKKPRYNDYEHLSRIKEWNN